MVAVFTSLIAWTLSSMFARILVGSGLALASYAGLSTIVDSMLSSVVSGFSGLGSDLASILYIAGVGQGISILGSAILTSVAFASARLFITRS